MTLLPLSLAFAAAISCAAFGQGVPPGDPKPPEETPPSPATPPGIPDWPTPGMPDRPGIPTTRPGTPGWNEPGAPGWQPPQPPARKRAELPPMLPMSREQARAVLSPLQGDWDMVLRLHVDPSKPPTRETGSSTFAPALEGNFLREDFRASIAGAPYVGVGYTGFEPARNQFSMVWIDADKGSATTARGVYDAATRTFTFLGLLDDPTLAEPLDTKTTLTIAEDARTLRYAFYYLAGGRDILALEIDYARAAREGE